MPYIDLPHHKLFFAQVGQAKAGRPSLVLLHGAGGNHLVWPKELLRLPETAVYALDLPGHGRSTGPGSDTIAAYADVVAEFLVATQLDQVVLAGHSMGGAVAQLLAVRQRPEVSGLVLISTGSRLRVADAILNQILPDFAAAVATINRFAWSASTPPAQVMQGRTAMAATEPPVLYGDFAACNAFDLSAELHAITCPTLVLAAEEDQLTPVKYGRFLADHIANCRLVVIPQAGHMVMIEQPTAVAAAIAEFLGELNSG